MKTNGERDPAPTFDWQLPKLPYIKDPNKRLFEFKVAGLNGITTGLLEKGTLEEDLTRERKRKEAASLLASVPDLDLSQNKYEEFNLDDARELLDYATALVNHSIQSIELSKAGRQKRREELAKAEQEAAARKAVVDSIDVDGSDFKEKKRRLSVGPAPPSEPSKLPPKRSGRPQRNDKALKSSTGSILLRGGSQAALLGVGSLATVKLPSEGSNTFLEDASRSNFDSSRTGSDDRLLTPQILRASGADSITEAAFEESDDEEETIAMSKSGRYRRSIIEPETDGGESLRKTLADVLVQYQGV
jgi:hypothetical protein